MLFNNRCSIEYCKTCSMMGVCLECIRDYQISDNSCILTQSPHSLPFPQLSQPEFSDTNRFLSSCYDQNCLNCNVTDNSCYGCAENFQLQNYTCVETKSSLNSSGLMIIIIGITVPVVFTILFCVV